MRGVVLDGGERLSAPTVVSSVDVVTTLSELVDDPRTRPVVDRLAPLDHFRSPFSVCLGLRDARPGVIAGSPVKVVFPGTDTEAQDRAQLRGVVEDASVSIGVPTLMNDTLAPAGHDIALLYTFVGREQIRELLADDAAATTFAQRLVAAADRGLPGLAERVVSLVPSTTAVPSIYTRAHGRRARVGTGARGAAGQPARGAPAAPAAHRGARRDRRTACPDE